MIWTMRTLAGFILLGSGILLFAQTKSTPQMTGKLIDVGGYRVHLYCTGTGEPAVVVASGGFSFDWGLVQPQVAQITRICTYDPAGTAWSDPLPQKPNPNCADRVTELHNLLKAADVKGPHVLVGFSIGGLEARLYAVQYPDEVSGMVFVDHAFIDTRDDSPKVEGSIAKSGLDSAPVLISKTPITLDIEDDWNFAKLPERDQKLHRWALAIHSFRPTTDMAAVCFSEVDKAEQKKSFPLGNKPVAVVSTLYDSPRYRELQRHLLVLSHKSKQFIADDSSHMVIIDQPEVVIEAIQYVVAAVRIPAGR